MIIDLLLAINIKYQKYEKNNVNNLCKIRLGIRKK